MYLKKIILDGFKSFADKGIFHFKPGFTVITGPNGCGKSNVVDAIKWTLGEQRAKSLRGKQMLDVIFGGNDARRPADYAQVSMFFSISPGELPIEGNEVVISRKLTKKGESTYLINRKPARLKDIRSLFLDTGIGAAGYYVMEQGKIDFILNAGLLERRTVFEEAAGISKFKAQKKETLQKLTRVDANLNRLLDILQELSSRLKSVQTQAGKARKHQDYTEEIHKLKLAQGAAQYHIYLRRQKELDDGLEKYQLEIQNLGEASQEFEASLEEILHLRRDKEAVLDTYQKEAITLTEKISHLQSNIENDQALFRDMSEDRLRSKEEQKKNRQKIAQIQKELEKLSKELEREERKHQQISELLKKKEDELSSMEAESSQGLEELERKKGKIIELLHIQTDIQNRLSSATSKLQGLDATKSRVDGRMEDALRKQRELLFLRDQKEKELRELEEEVELLEQEEKFLQEEIQKKGDEEKELSKSLQEDLDQLARLESRLEVLDQISLDDVEGGVELLLSAKEEKKIKGIHDLLIHHFEVDLEYALAVEAALDKFLYGLVVDDEQALEKAMFYLEEQKAGRALLLPLKPLPDLPNPPLPQGVFSFMEVVEAKPPYETLLESLLRDYGMVDSMDKALAVRGDGPIHLVTRKGEILYLFGPVQSGSSQKGQKSSLVQKTELRELQQQSESLKQGVETKSARVQSLVEMVATHRTHLDESRRELTARRVEVMRLRTDLRQLEERVSEQKIIQENCSLEWEEAQLEYSSTEGIIKKMTGTLEESKKESRQTEQEIGQMEKKLVGVQTKQRSHADKITALKVEVASSERQMEAGREMLERMKDELEERKLRENSSDREEQSLECRKAALQEKIQISTEDLAESQKRVAFLEENISVLEEERAEFLHREEELKSQGESSFMRFQKISEKISSLKVQRSKVEVRLEDLLERVQDALHIHLPDVLDEIDLTDIDLEVVDQRAQELSGKLRRLGNVNFEALEELKELEERYGDLKKQETDLVQSKNSLVEIIEHLDQISKERFETTFNTIRSHFQQLFRKLFGGGKADLVLEGGDILEAGIDIIAKPPGKEPRSITLLSGGEKTMTTVALAFSIFQFKPSPFCVLDEVDAALDETNIGRFLLMLQDFVDNCQFIIISHSRQTISAADVIYGVTMEESGVSKNLSLELKQVEEQVSLQNS